MKTILIRLYSILFIVFACSNAQAQTIIKNQHEIVGIYASVSESEWHQILTLNRNGSAELRTISWLPGEPNSEEEEKENLQWSSNSQTEIELTARNKKIILKYNPQISLAEEFDLPGQHEGLTVINGAETIFSTLWKEPRIFLKALNERALKD